MNEVGKEEQSFVNDLIEGKKSGFQKLYDLMFPPLYSFASKYLEDKLLLEDYIQESFISFWKKRTDFTNLSSIKSYLYTSVKNNCLNHLKHQDVKRKNQEYIAIKIESEQYYSNALIEEETFNLLYTEIKNLPESTQQIMLLALNGLKNPEIADELGISINTVKTLKKKAYAKLRDKLSPSLNYFLFSILF
jgi:RNA polymerase sigma-70 factor (ECF subfamily)